MDNTISMPERIKQLISGHLTDALSAEELAALQAWVDESPDHKRCFNELRYAWALSDTRSTERRRHGASLWKLSERLRRLKGKERAFWTLQRIAASWLIVMLGSGALGWNLKKGVADEAVAAVSAAAATTVQARMGSQSIIDLPDGTRVWLNGGSALEYGSDYGEGAREVQLVGEACFEVSTDPENPFIVRAGGLTIKALGATFNVKAYPEDNFVTATLVEGKVTVTGKDENNRTFSYEMRPNENFTYLTELAPSDESTAQAQSQPTSDRNYMPEIVVIENNVNINLHVSWKDDFWVIERQKLGDLARNLERRYNVRIEFASERVTEYHFSGTIQNETAEQVLRIMSRTIPLKYSFDKNVVTIAEDVALAREFNLKNR